MPLLITAVLVLLACALPIDAARMIPDIPDPIGTFISALLAVVADL